MFVTTVTPTTIQPTAPPTEHTLAAAGALARAEFLLQPVGIPEDPPLPDLHGAREALLEAVAQLNKAKEAAGDTYGVAYLDAALVQAHAGLEWLDRPAIKPPVAEVLGYTMQAGDLARLAVDAFETGQWLE